MQEMYKLCEDKIKNMTKEIDEKLLRKLCEIQCTDEELASCLETTTKRLGRLYGDKIESWRRAGRCSLRRAQWSKALSGDSVMLRHLGRVYLGQTDQITLTSEEPQVRKLLALWERPTGASTSTLAGKKDSNLLYDDTVQVNPRAIDSQTIECKTIPYDNSKASASN